MLIKDIEGASLGEKIRMSNWPFGHYIYFSFPCWRNQDGHDYCDFIIGDQWELFESTLAVKSLIDEIKECEFWRENYKFLETAQHESHSIILYTFGNVYNPVDSARKDFRGYVFRNRRQGKLFISTVCNLWSDERGDSEILPLTKRHEKIEPLGVLLEN